MAFLQNLDGVKNLGASYINLCESGFVDPNGWSQEFDCRKDKIIGESVAVELRNALREMRECYDRWKQKLNNARNEFKQLNFFTGQQLVLLRREIASVCHDDLSVTNNEVLMLLESIRPGLKSKDLKSAIQQALGDLSCDQIQLPASSYLLSQAPNVKRNSIADPSTVTEEISKIQSFLSAAENRFFPDKVALAALASQGIEADEEDLLLWCSERSDDEEVKVLCVKAMNNPTIVRAIQPEITNDVSMDRCR